MIKTTDSKANFALLVATLAFAANFSVWTLYSVIGIDLRDQLQLSATEYGFLLAAPILTGALLRFPIGLLTEVISCRRLYFWQMVFIIPPLFYLPYVSIYTEYIILGLVLGTCGVSFTIGIRYVVEWFPTSRQGYAMGMFGAGNAGAAITLVLVPLITTHFGADRVGPFYGVGMISMYFANHSAKQKQFLREVSKSTVIQASKANQEVTTQRNWQFCG
jgi:NNP family nitrate/nitrite transporter-like MFS transporter